MLGTHWRLEVQRLKEIEIRNRAKILGMMIVMGGIAIAFAYLWSRPEDRIKSGSALIDRPAPPAAC
jgi:hypothetical protein